MPAAAFPIDEEERLRSLSRSGLLQGRVDPRIKVITSLAAVVLERQSAALSLVQAETQTLLSRVNLPISRTLRSDSFCAHAILQPDRALVVQDAALDRRFSDNKLVTDRSIGIRFYAGMPIRWKNGQPVGALCVLDQVPGSMSEAQVEVLQKLGQFVEQIIQQPHPLVSERLSILSELRRATELDSFDIEWQPIRRVDTLQVSGYETLIRWTRSNGAIMPPDSFIPLAEGSGLIRKIDRAIINHACSKAALNGPCRVSVNVSAGWFRTEKPTLSRFIAKTLAATGLPPDYLTLELTERVLVNDASLALRAMRDLKSLGVRLALDDFGIGYSSLSYLAAFPLDILKLDKAFVRGLGSNTMSETVARAILQLGHDLGMSVCAEGVETHQQLAFLREQNCDFVQGYLMGRPGPLPKDFCPVIV